MTGSLGQLIALLSLKISPNSLVVRWKTEAGLVLVSDWVAKRSDDDVLSVSQHQSYDTDSEPKFWLLSLALPGKETSSSTVGITLGERNAKQNKSEISPHTP